MTWKERNTCNNAWETIYLLIFLLHIPIVRLLIKYDSLYSKRLQ